MFSEACNAALTSAWLSAANCSISSERTAGSLLSAIAGYTLLRLTSGIETNPEDEEEEAEIFGADDEARRAARRARGLE